MGGQKGSKRDIKSGTFGWYAKQLNISEKTAKRRGKVLLEKQLLEQSKPLINKLKSGVKTQFSENNHKYAHMLLDEKSVTSETRTIGIRLLNKTLRELETLVEEGCMADPYQRSYVLIHVAKLILGHKA